MLNCRRSLPVIDVVFIYGNDTVYLGFLTLFLAVVLVVCGLVSILLINYRDNFFCECRVKVSAFFYFCVFCVSVCINAVK
jgi:predicted signal transduction protein with EAL and GGDEF domain